MYVRSHAHKEKKKEEGRIYTRIENGSTSIGIKKSRRERERKRSSTQVLDRIMFMYM
jgi:hypothetical protein